MCDICLQLYGPGPDMVSAEVRVIYGYDVRKSQFAFPFTFVSPWEKTRPIIAEASGPFFVTQFHLRTLRRYAIPIWKVNGVVWEDKMEENAGIPIQRESGKSFGCFVREARSSLALTRANSTAKFIVVWLKDTGQYLHRQNRSERELGRTNGFMVFIDLINLALEESYEQWLSIYGLVEEYVNASVSKPLQII